LVGPLHQLPPAFDLLLFSARPLHHHLALIEALVREFPEQLAAVDGEGRTPLVVATEAGAGCAEIVPLLAEASSAHALGHSLQHLVGYTPAEKVLVSAQRRTLMCSLNRLADEGGGGLGGEDVPGELNVRKAVRTYMKGGQDPFSVIGSFAF
jgi:hypothetical protein